MRRKKVMRDRLDTVIADQHSIAILTGVNTVLSRVGVKSRVSRRLVRSSTPRRIACYSNGFEMVESDLPERSLLQRDADPVQASISIDGQGGNA